MTMSSTPVKRVRNLRARVISPIPLAAGLGLISAGSAHAVAVANDDNLEAVITSGWQTVGNVLTNDAGTAPLTLLGVLPSPPGPGVASSLPDGTLRYNVQSCPAAGTVAEVHHQIRDGDPSTANGIAHVTFVAPAVDDAYATPVGIPVSFNVLSNDRPTGNVSPVASFTLPSNGSLTPVANGEFQYEPAANFVGTDTFSYTLNTGLNCPTNTAQVTVTVTPPAASISAVPTTSAGALGALASLLALSGMRRRRDD